MRIFFETRPVAELVAGDIGPSMVYDPSWIALRGAFPVSSRMPVRHGVYGPETVLPWIVNLLPEERNLEAVARITGTGKADALGILAEIGRDTSGALSFDERGTARMEYRIAADETALERIINELPSKPFLAGEDGVSMSLAGVQTKLGVHLDDRGRICVPINGSPSTWILKPDSERLWGGVANEAFCLMLARNSGIAAPTVRIGKAGGRSYLLVARYDRTPEGDTWRRLHQEDFCQALGHFPATKYERNGSNRPGPRIRDLIGTTRTLMGIGDVLTIMQQVIFNIIVCNTDAHAKNYSMMVRGDGFSISPIYDVMCAAVWPKVTKYLAMSVATKRDGNHLLGKHWQREAALCGLGRPALLRAVGQMCDRVDARLDATVDEVVAMHPEGRMMVELCRQEIRTRIGHLRAGMKETESDSTIRAARHDVEPPKT